MTVQGAQRDPLHPKGKSFTTSSCSLLQGQVPAFWSQTWIQIATWPLPSKSLNFSAAQVFSSVKGMMNTPAWGVVRNVGGNGLRTTQLSAWNCQPS